MRITAKDWDKMSISEQQAYIREKGTPDIELTRFRKQVIQWYGKARAVFEEDDKLSIVEMLSVLLEKIDFCILASDTNEQYKAPSLADFRKVLGTCIIGINGYIKDNNIVVRTQKVNMCIDEYEVDRYTKYSEIYFGYSAGLIAWILGNMTSLSISCKPKYAQSLKAAYRDSNIDATLRTHKDQWSVSSMLCFHVGSNCPVDIKALVGETRKTAISRNDFNFTLVQHYGFVFGKFEDQNIERIAELSGNKEQFYAVFNQQVNSKIR